MELRQIQYFIEVAKREHVTEAAHSLHVAQSAVSRQLFNLEEELGVPLFIREGRNVKLTPIGRKFLNHMEKALKVIETAKREIEEYVDPYHGTIRVGFPSSISAYTMPEVISSFRELYPNVKFQLKQGSYHSLIESVINGSIDMALLGPVPLHNKKLKGSVLFSEQMVALLPNKHPLAMRNSIKLSELMNESFVLFPEGYILREIILKACRQLGFQPEISFEGEDIDAIKGLVSAGLGITLLPEITLIDSAPRSTVKVRVTDPYVTRTVGVIISNERQLLPSQENFYQFLKEFFTVLDKYQN